MTSLPIPDALQEAHSQQLARFIQNQISAAGGWIPFSDFMQAALYAPQLGYYSGGAKKFGIGGDFVTAPEISALFGQTLANQLAQILSETGGDILELGAGTGRLAADVLNALEQLSEVPVRYCILEVSAYLHHIQREYLESVLSPELMARVVWLDHLPDHFTGVVIGNEVLDAIPVHLLHQTASGLQERGVACAHGFVWEDRPLTDEKLRFLASRLDLPEDYVTEVCPAASALIGSLAQILQRGAILMLDYGFSGREYYHPQRRQGTLMCHYQHYAHTDPLIYPGLQDITAHVDFTAIAQAGIDNGLSLAGYTSQARFLLNCGILDLLGRVSSEDAAQYLPLAAAVQKLLSPAEMGDLFKVIAFEKSLALSWQGFASGDKTHTL